MLNRRLYAVGAASIRGSVSRALTFDEQPFHGVYLSTDA
jgi:hypothetical protein